MLQAYVDGSTERGELFVLAGYVARAGTWATFSDDWQAELDRPQKLAAFKMAAQARQHPRRAERFYRVIEKHVTMAISVSVRIPELNKVMDEAHWPPQVGNIERLRNPYFYGFQVLMSQFGLMQTRAGIHEPVNFIFDDQTEKMVVLENWERTKATMTGDAARFLGDKPDFKDDEKVLPLQAADFWAWWVRHWLVNGAPLTGISFDFPWEAKRDILRLSLNSTEDDIRINLKRVLDRAWKAAELHSLIHGPISWCRPTHTF